MNKNYFHALIFTILIFFGGSFYLSAFPDKFFSLLEKSPITIGIPPQFSLPPSARRAIFELSGEVLNSIPLSDKNAWENSKLDAALVPRSWLKQERQEIKSDFFYKEISSDFQFIEDKNLRILPLFWKADKEKKEEKIQFLYFIIRNPFHISQSFKKAFISQIVQNLWTQETGWASTLVCLDDLNLSNHLKAQNFKNFNLTNLKVEKFFNSSPPTTTSNPNYTTSTTITTLPIPVLKKKKSH